MNEYDNQYVEVNQAPLGGPTTDPNAPQKKGFGIASLVLGITSIVPGCCCTYVGIVLGILAVVFGILFLNVNKELKQGKGMAIAGIVLGGIGFIVCVGFLIFGLIIGTSSGYSNFMNDFINQMQESMPQ